MEDLEYDDSPNLISDVKGAIVLVVLFVIVVVVGIILSIISGFATDLWQAEPIVMILVFIGIILFVLFFSFFMIWSEIQKTKKKANEEQARIDRLKKFHENQLPFLYKTINNHNGEYKTHICSLCHEAIGSDVKIISCPNCNAVFHLNHLLVWIEKMDECPQCQFLMKKKD